MKTNSGVDRRSFLKFLGLSAVAAPTIVAAEPAEQPMLKCPETSDVPKQSPTSVQATEKCSEDAGNFACLRINGIEVKNLLRPAS